MTSRRISSTLCGALALLVYLSSSADAFVPSFVSWGYCSEPPLQVNFDPLKYQGWWFDIERVPNEYQKVETCLNTNCTWTGHGLENNLRGLTAEGEKSGKIAIMTTDLNREPADPAFMALTSSGVPDVNYQVLATDYIHFSCVYSCLQLPGVFAEFFWIFGREPTMAKKFRHICYKKFEAAGIDTGKLTKVDQNKDCPYYSTLDQKMAVNKRLFDSFATPTESSFELHTVAELNPNEWQQDDADSITYRVPEEHLLPEAMAVGKQLKGMALTDGEPGSSFAIAILASPVFTCLLVLCSLKSYLLD